ncbi:MAG: hypothetical protein Q7S06_01160 [Nanoarchaeota archaeon]|nr:hypothetical protein [Nanoarchaeota archaeon]
MKKRGYIEKDFSSSEIPLWLDDYNDLFSDFDPRHYSHRALSQDFLEELKRASRDKKPRRIQLELLVPKEKRNLKEEFVISKRLKEHFMKHFLTLKKEYQKTLKEGVIFLVFGIAFMILTTYFLINRKDNYFLTLISVFLEPGGWFLFWEGLYLMIFESRKKHPDLKFYKKMSRLKTEFRSY